MGKKGILDQLNESVSESVLYLNAKQSAFRGNNTQFSKSTHFLNLINFLLPRTKVIAQQKTSTITKKCF